MTEEYIEQMGWEIEPYTEEELNELYHLSLYGLADLWEPTEK